MKTPLIGIIVLCTTLFGSGCVRRTVTTEPTIRGAAAAGKSLGGQTQSKTVEDQLIWIWQDEYRQGK